MVQYREILGGEVMIRIELEGAGLMKTTWSFGNNSSIADTVKGSFR